MKNYYPILASKKGELDALRKLDTNIKKTVSPIIEVSETTIFKNKKDRATNTYNWVYIETVLDFLLVNWSFDDNEINLDFNTIENIEQHLEFIENSIRSLMDSNVNFSIVIYQNSNSDFIELISNLFKDVNPNICIRYSNETGGYLNFDSVIENTLETFDVDFGNLSLLLDAGQIDESNYNLMASTIGLTLRNSNYNLNEFRAVIVSSSSFPENLNEFSESDIPYFLERYEIELFNGLISNGMDFIKYSDYGIKSSKNIEVNYSGSISLKYSTLKNYMVFRGIKSEHHRLGHKQFINHSRRLVETEHYFGRDYSWGDLRYLEISQESLEDGKSGNTTQWVEYCQNHHITMICNSF